MAESRLFRIIYHLLDQGSATAPELARELEVSVRTIYRDIEALSGAGLPVYAEPGRKGGIRLLEGHVLDRAFFSEPERLELLTALQSLSATGFAQDREMLTKLSALFGVDAGDWLEVDFSRWGDFSSDKQRFETLKTAVTRHLELRLTYENARGERSERTVQPLTLCFKAREWYLKAFCLERQDHRLFKLNRISALRLTDKTFLPRPWPEEDAPPPAAFPEVVLRFERGVAYRVYDEFDESQITPQPDGALIARARMPADDWLTGYLLSFGAAVTVLEPAVLNRVLAEEARKIWEKHRDGTG